MRTIVSDENLHLIGQLVSQHMGVLWGPTTFPWRTFLGENQWVSHYNELSLNQGDLLSVAVPYCTSSLLCRSDFPLYLLYVFYINVVGQVVGQMAVFWWWNHPCQAMAAWSISMAKSYRTTRPQSNTRMLFYFITGVFRSGWLIDAFHAFPTKDILCCKCQWLSVLDQPVMSLVTSVFMACLLVVFTETS